MNSLALLRDLVAIPGPPGQEGAVCDYLAAKVAKLGLKSTQDQKGNLLVSLTKTDEPARIVVVAHMDEIAMIVRKIEPDGSLSVTSLGGLFPWKLGEGPVEILAEGEALCGVLSFGSIHTADPNSTVRIADKAAITWNQAKVVTGLTKQELIDAKVRPGTRVVVARHRRSVVEIGNLIGSYFLDDRADLVAWLLALEVLKDSGLNVLFLASTAEEVGGEGALFAMHHLRPDVCIALELGPAAIDAPVELTDQPTVWANDSYSTMSAADASLVSKCGDALDLDLQFQALSRGGSDASCAASHGLVARPITLGLAMENSHGFEIMHPNAIDQLARLTVQVIKAVEKTL